MSSHCSESSRGTRRAVWLIGVPSLRGAASRKLLCSKIASPVVLLCLPATIPGVARPSTTLLCACCLCFLHLCLYQLPVDSFARYRRWIVSYYHSVSEIGP